MSTNMYNDSVHDKKPLKLLTGSASDVEIGLGTIGNCLKHPNSVYCDIKQGKVENVPVGGAETREYFCICRLIIDLNS